MEKIQQVNYKIENSVMVINIDNPMMKNGLNYIGINQLADCFETMKTSHVRVAIIYGNDEYFFTGGRVDPSMPGEQDEYSAAIARYEKLLYENTVPLIAAISGDCLKAGMGLLARCDFAIARKGVKFGFPEVRMGGVPMMVMVSTIDTMPRKKALEAYLTSWNFSAEEALQMGLINKIVEKEDFDPTIRKYAEVFLNTPADLIEMTKRAYEELSKLKTYEERSEFAMRMLKTEVLPTMSKIKTEYNV